MDDFKLLMNMEECHKYILKSINSAKNVIYLANWQIDLTYNLDKNTSDPLYITLLNKCNEGVKIYVITSVSPFIFNITNNNLKILETINHPNLKIKILDLENSNFFISGLSKIVNFIAPKYISFSNCCKRLFHQRYLNVDNKHCMIGGTDLVKSVYNNINYEKYNLIKKHYWIEYGVIFTQKNDFKKFCIENFNQDGKAMINSSYLFGNFYDVNTQYSKVISLINNCQESIYIENQWIYSTNFTKNEIIKHIADKIIEKYNSKQKFNVTIISNYQLTKYCNITRKNIFDFKYVWCVIERYYTNKLLFKSLKYLYKYLKKNKIPKNKINDLLSIYVFKNNIYMHNKIFIIDNFFITGTSNLWDRSYTKGNDIELSILLTGPKIKNIKQKIFNSYQNDIERIYLSNNISIAAQTNHILYCMFLVLLTFLILIFFIYIVFKNIHHIKKILFFLF